MKGLPREDFQKIVDVQDKYSIQLLIDNYGGTGIAVLDDGSFALGINVRDQAVADLFKKVFRDEIEGVPVVFRVRGLASAIPKRGQPYKDK